jgi:hypothetical protein
MNRDLSGRRISLSSLPYVHFRRLIHFCMPTRRGHSVLTSLSTTVFRICVRFVSENRNNNGYLIAQKPTEPFAVIIEPFAAIYGSKGQIINLRPEILDENQKKIKRPFFDYFHSNVRRRFSGVREECLNQELYLFV